MSLHVYPMKSLTLQNQYLYIISIIILADKDGDQSRVQTFSLHDWGKQQSIIITHCMFVFIDTWNARRYTWTERCLEEYNNPWWYLSIFLRWACSENDVTEKRVQPQGENKTKQKVMIFNGGNWWLVWCSMQRQCPSVSEFSKNLAKHKQILLTSSRLEALNAIPHVLSGSRFLLISAKNFFIKHTKIYCFWALWNFGNFWPPCNSRSGKSIQNEQPYSIYEQITKLNSL